MKLANKLLIRFGIDEKVILINKGSKNGNVVFLAGGAGSGKGFSIEKLIDSSSYKIFDVDGLKKSLIKLSKIGKIDPTLANLDLRNPEDVLKLHQYVKEKGFDDKVVDNFLSSAKKSGGLPNVMFDITFKDLSNFKEKVGKLLDVGYKEENIHLVWVLADYKVSVENNRKRDRVVPEDIVLATHKGAAKTMFEILSGQVPADIKGEIYVVLSDSEMTSYKDRSGKVKKFSEMEKGFKEKIVIEDFPYLKVEDKNDHLNKDNVNKIFFDWAKTRVPKEVSQLFV